MSERQPIVSILVPVYNEERTLLPVLEALRDFDLERFEIIVVDDASSDASLELIESFAADQSRLREHVTVTLLRHPTNRGKGAAIKSGLAVAQGAYFTVQDADFELDPTELRSLIDLAVSEELDAVYGSRFLGTIENMAPANYYANKAFNRILRILYRTQITDMHSCYKVVPTALLRDLDLDSERFGYATEIVSKLLKRGVTIHERPISFRGRSKEDGKKIGMLDGVDCLYQIFRYWMVLPRSATSTAAEPARPRKHA